MMDMQKSTTSTERDPVSNDGHRQRLNGGLSEGTSHVTETTLERYLPSIEQAVATNAQERASHEYDPTKTRDDNFTVHEIQLGLDAKSIERKHEHDMHG